jgi:hypothetical protein
MTAATISQKPAEEQLLDAIWRQRCAVLNRAWVQVRYQRRRQRFFDLADKLHKCLLVMLMASVFGRFYEAFQPWLSFTLISLAVFDLAFGCTYREQLHKALAEQAAKLVADIEQVPVDALAYANTAAWAAEYARLVAVSPPPLKTLSLLCEREQAISEGHPDHVALPSWWRRVVAHLF